MARHVASRGALHRFFELGVIVKGIDGALEIVGAVLLFVVKPGWIRHVATALTWHELSEDPHDLIARHVLQAARRLSARGEIFASVYLLVHGVVKVALVWALLRTKLWAYPVAIAIFTAFGVYQVYRYAVAHSAAMLALTVLDVFVIGLTWMEYRRLRQEHRGAGAASGVRHASRA